MAQYYNMTFNEFLESYALDENAFKKEVLGTEIILYACFDKLGLKVPANIVDEKAEEYATAIGSTKEEIINQYTENYIECMYVEEQTVEKLVEKALANSNTK